MKRDCLLVLAAHLALASPSVGDVKFTQLAEDHFLVHHRKLTKLGAEAKATRTAFIEAASICVAAGFTHMEIKESNVGERHFGGTWGGGRGASADLRIKTYWRPAEELVETRDLVACRALADPTKVRLAKRKLVYPPHSPEISEALGSQVPQQEVRDSEEALSPIHTLDRLAQLLEKGLLSRAEFDQAKAQVLAELSESPSDSAASVQSEPPTSRGQSDWTGALKSLDAQLLAADWRAAHTAASSLVTEIANEIHAGQPGASHLVAVATAFRALAETARGRKEHGLWLWSLAKSLDPGFEQAPLERYGEPGQWLESQPTRNTFADGDLASVRPPKVLKRVDPRLPRGKGGVRPSGRVVLEVLLTEDGIPFEPRVISVQGSPGLAYLAAEAVREWRFEPALEDGTPVVVPMQVTVNIHDL